jgi:hypoxanthine phosphoribosyltransferase
MSDCDKIAVKDHVRTKERGTIAAMTESKVLLSSEEIQKRVKALAQALSNDYEGKNPLLICLLKGACVFFADLMRQFTIPHEIDFITMSSYRNGLRRSEKVEMVDHLRSSVEDRDIIIVEGIIDTGHTLSELIKTLSKRSVRSLKVCTLLDKPHSREIDVPVDYVGFSIPDVFVVGYGLDYKERYRNLTHVISVPGEGVEKILKAEAGRGRHSARTNVEPEYSTITPDTAKKRK